jgi:hypothetical protein
MNCASARIDEARYSYRRAARRAPAHIGHRHYARITMKLWLFDCNASEEDIEAGCQAAAELIEKRGFSVEQAYDAVMKRSNRERFERRAAQAWDDAEDAALEVTYRGEEPPDEPVLGPESERETRKDLN